MGLRNIGAAGQPALADLTGADTLASEIRDPPAELGDVKPRNVRLQATYISVRNRSVYYGTPRPRRQAHHENRK